MSGICRSAGSYPDDDISYCAATSRAVISWIAMCRSGRQRCNIYCDASCTLTYASQFPAGSSNSFLLMQTGHGSPSCAVTMTRKVGGRLPRAAAADAPLPIVHSLLVLSATTTARARPADCRATSGQTDASASGVATPEHGSIPRFSWSMVSLSFRYWFRFSVSSNSTIPRTRSLAMVG